MSDTKTTEERIADNNAELAALALMKSQKAISIQVLKRFMSDEELKELGIKYVANRQYGTGRRDRVSSLRQPITDDEVQLLKEYFTEKFSTVDEIGKRHGLTNGGKKGAVYKIGRIALRFLFQNQDLVGL